jgi:HAE1 family hydrophobic/amphiphilic exporter-1
MKLSDVSIRRPVLATVMMAVLIVFGVFGYRNLGLEMQPDVEFPIVTVTAIYPGADPETIETKVVDKLEESINTITGIKVMRSTSMESVGLIVLQFDLARNADQALQDVRDKIAAVQADLPAGVDPPVAEKVDIGAAPVLSLALSGDLPTRELTRLADDVVKQRIQTIRGVGDVEIVGGREREFHVWVDPRRLEQYWLAVGDVAQAIVAQNMDVPGGRLNVGDRELVVKTRGQVSSKEELEDIIITSAMGSPIRVRDVARVEDGEEEARSYSSLNGTSAVAVTVKKQSGSNTVEVAHAVKAALEQLRPRLEKAGVTLSIPVDNSTYVENMIHDVQFDLYYGAILAIVIILFFLHDWRATFISALAIPTSVIATMAFLNAMGYTLNMITMLALSLSIGILIDDAIVVIENIHRHLQMGKPPMRAAREATAEIGLAVTATTASILAVFVPVATMEGMIGRFFVQFGLTVAFAVTVSLFVAFTLTPMLAARMLSTGHGKRPNVVARGIEWFLHGIERGYRAILGAALRQRTITVLLAIAVLAGSLKVAGLVKSEFMPTEDRGQLKVSFELPAGTDLAATKRFAVDVDEELRRIPGVAMTFLTIGGGVQGEVNKGDIQVELVDKEERAFGQAEAIDYVRGLMAQRTGALFAVEPFESMRASSAFRNAMIQYNLRGNDYAELNGLASAVIAKMKEKGGYVDIDTTYRAGKPEVDVELDRTRAADLGVPVALVAQTVRALLAADEISEIETDGDRYPVRLRLDEPFRRSAADLSSLKVRSTSGQLVHLSSVARISEGSGPAAVDRQARQRQVTILANLTGGKTLGEAIGEIEAIRAEVVPDHIVTDWTGFADIMQESFMNLMTALILAVIMVYLILAAQFESFIHPFTIMLSLPLSVVGAFGALYISGMTISIMTMIGIILLMGLVTKNAILLVDYANQLRQQGLDKHAALLKAGPIRLRPILMTTAAMIFGMVPVAMALSEGSEGRAPMAVAVIGGLITSTLLTLVVVPVVYSLLDGLATFMSRRRRKAAPEEVAAVFGDGKDGALADAN